MRDAEYIRIPLHSRGRIAAYALVDKVDEYLGESRWNLSDDGYGVRQIHRRSVLLHREVLGLAPGDGKQADHINGNRRDCRRSNLRVATHQQNAQNVPARSATSRHRGVSYCAQTRRWRATAQLAGKWKHLGRFDTEAEAAEAARAFRAEHMPYANEDRSEAA